MNSMIKNVMLAMVIRRREVWKQKYLQKMIEKGKELSSRNKKVLIGTQILRAAKCIYAKY